MGDFFNGQMAVYEIIKAKRQELAADNDTPQAVITTLDDLRELVLDEIQKDLEAIGR